jgi:hypothetical protein
MDEISANGESCAFFFFFVGANVDAYAAIRARASLWDLLFSDEEDCVGSLDAVAYSLGKSAKFIGI